MNPETIPVATDARKSAKDPAMTQSTSPVKPPVKAPVVKKAAAAAKATAPVAAVATAASAAKPAKVAKPVKVSKAVVKVAADKAAKPVKPVKPAAPAKPVKATKVKVVDKVKEPKAERADGDKPRKEKLVRDSFTMPKIEYDTIAELKKRALEAGREVKKSEVLRAGLVALKAMSHDALAALLTTVPKIKTGRPKKRG
jgi:hypothetical protein